MPADRPQRPGPTAPDAQAAGEAGAALTKALVHVLDSALRTLAEAGRKEEACELAAQGWVLLREAHPELGQRLNGTLHYLTRDRLAPRRATASRGAPETAPEAPRPPLDPPLDVRPLPPARRHERIFETYAALGVDQAFVLINDHDPKPLYYQFAAEQAGRFAWEPLESGPEVWRVRIAKKAPTRQE